MQALWEIKRTDAAKGANTSDKRASERRAVTLPARLAWKDQRGVKRFASVVTRDISESGVFVEATSPLSIPLYRLVQFQFESTVRTAREVPEALRQGRVLSAVYRVSHKSQQARPGVALRLLIEPRRLAAPAREIARATA